MFTNRETASLIASLKSEISDLRAALREERADFAKERAALLDRIMALTAPGAHQLLHPKPQRPFEVKDFLEKPKSRRLHYPRDQHTFPLPSSGRIMGPDFTHPEAAGVEPDVVGEAPPAEPS